MCMGHSSGLRFFWMAAVAPELPGASEMDTDNLESKQVPWNMGEDYGCAYFSLLNLSLQLHFSRRRNLDGLVN